MLGSSKESGTQDAETEMGMLDTWVESPERTGLGTITLGGALGVADTGKDKGAPATAGCPWDAVGREGPSQGYPGV